MMHINWRRSFAAILVLTFSPLALAQSQTAAKEDRSALEAQLATRLTNARMTGFYTIEGREGPPQPDEYTLCKVQKAEGDKWTFIAVMAYHGKDLALPLEIPVMWAGDTPVISVTDLKLLGMGSYTARVMIYGDHYAGTWSSGSHVGYLWGHIEHIAHDATTRSSAPSEKK